MKADEHFVEFKSRRLTLRGMIHAPRRRAPAPGVLFLHGFTGQRMEANFIFVRTARELAAAGIASLRFDFAGSGESEGRFEDATPLTELADARAALDVLASRRGVDARRLGVVGLSMGGCVAGMLLEDKRLLSAALWAAVADLGPILQTAAPVGAKVLMRRKGYIERGAFKLGSRFIEDAEQVDPLIGVACSCADILVIHGTADQTVPFEQAHMFEGAARSRVLPGARTELALISGASHTFDSVVHQDEVVSRTVAWFGRALADGKRRR